MKKLNKYIKWVASVFLTVWLSYSLIYAWNWLIASDGDTLTATKWNELVNKVTTLESNSTSWWVQFWTTCTTSSAWVMKLDSTNNTMSVCLEWEWQEFAKSIKIWETQDKPGTSCKNILDNGWNRWDWLYWVNMWSGAEQVYCDMTTDWGWYMLVVTLTNQTTNISWSVPPWNKGLWTPSIDNFYSKNLNNLTPWTDWTNFMIKEWAWKWVATDLIETYNTYAWKTGRYTWTWDNHLLMWKVSWNLRWDVVSQSYINKAESWDAIRWIKSCSNEWWCSADWNEWLSIAYWVQNRWPCYSWSDNISFWNARWHSEATRIALCWWWYSDPR